MDPNSPWPSQPGQPPVANSPAPDMQAAPAAAQPQQPQWPQSQQPQQLLSQPQSAQPQQSQSPQQLLNQSQVYPSQPQQFPGQSHMQPQASAYQRTDYQEPNGGFPFSQQMMAHAQSQSQVRRQQNHKKTRKTMLIVVIVLLVLALAGVGVWALVQALQGEQETNNPATSTPTESQTNSQGGVVASTDCGTEVAYVPAGVTEEMYLAQKAAFDEAVGRLEDDEKWDFYRRQVEPILKDFETFQDHYSIRRATGNFICLDEDRIKIAIPENMSDVRYRIETQSGMLPTTLEIYGAKIDGEEITFVGDEQMDDMSLGGITWLNLDKVRYCDSGNEVTCYYENAPEVPAEDIEQFKANALVELNNGLAIGYATGERGMSVQALQALGTIDEAKANEANRKINLIYAWLSMPEVYSVLQD